MDQKYTKDGMKQKLYNTGRQLERDRTIQKRHKIYCFQVT